jgi:hypothetical protein
MEVFVKGVTKMFEALSQLNPKNRVGIVAGIRKDPFDRDLRLVEIFQEKKDKKTGHTKPITHTLKTTARNIQEERINEDVFVIWSLLENLHSISPDKVEELDINAGDLLRHYHIWLRIKSPSTVGSEL